MHVINDGITHRLLLHDMLQQGPEQRGWQTGQRMQSRQCPQWAVALGAELEFLSQNIVNQTPY